MRLATVVRLLVQAQKNLIQQVAPAISNLKQWLASMESFWAQSLSRWTLKPILKQADFRCKRVRKPPKDQLYEGG